MKTLRDLAIEWNEGLEIFFVPGTKHWFAKMSTVKFNGYYEIGEGETPEAALKMLCSLIVGTKAILSNGSKREVPEILCS